MLSTQVEEATKSTNIRSSIEHLLAGLSVVDLRVRWAIERARLGDVNPQDEFRGLYISNEQVDQIVSQPYGDKGWTPLPPELDRDFEHSLEEAFTRWSEETRQLVEAGIPLRLYAVAQKFGLIRLELEALLLILLPDLDPRYAKVYAYLQDDVTRKRPSIELVLNLLTTSFTEKLSLRRIFSSSGNLINHQLVELGPSERGDSNSSLLTEHVPFVPKHVTEFLLGRDRLDESLETLARLRDPQLEDDGEAKRHIAIDHLADKIPQLDQFDQKPILVYMGQTGDSIGHIVDQMGDRANQKILEIDLAALLKSGSTKQQLSLIIRDGKLHDAILFFKGTHPVDDHDKQLILDTILDYPEPVIITALVPWWSKSGRFDRQILHFTIPLPSYAIRYGMWQAVLPDSKRIDIEALANQFQFTYSQIASAALTAKDLAMLQNSRLETDHVLAACRAHSNQKLAQLATKITPNYGWDDIVLPRDTRAQLKEMINMVRQKPTVYSSWGFDKKLSIGKGLSALFSGKPGTGKTMSAEIMAGELGLDLYKIDISRVVSKYIGETEKNLEKIFTEATTSNAILFFDEADAIFGKRSEVKDSHDRYANLEISYLLQRMEVYDGIVILATNLRANMDDAFVRRLHFAIDFPVPDAKNRMNIWRVMIPADTPVDPDIDFDLLAKRYEISGGHIKNIVLSAAFLAAEQGTAMGMPHLLHAARREFQKLGRFVDDTFFQI